jgi:hypothetical protein
LPTNFSVYLMHSNFMGFILNILYLVILLNILSDKLSNFIMLNILHLVILYMSDMSINFVHMFINYL